MFQCKHCYVGTIVYHKNCSLLKVLSGILGEQKKCVEKKRECHLNLCTVAMKFLHH